MEILIQVNGTREEADALRDARLDAGAVEISESALLVAFSHIVEEKNKALDDQDFEKAAEWKDEERNILAALARLGLAQPLT